MKRVLTVFKRRNCVIYPEMTFKNNGTDSIYNDSNIDFESKSYYDSDHDTEYDSQPKFGIDLRKDSGTEYDSNSDSDSDNNFAHLMDVSNNDVRIYRSYTITCERDDWNIKNGRCPDYALDWQDCFNQKHWPIGHDFINGNQEAQGREQFLY